MGRSIVLILLVVLFAPAVFADDYKAPVEVLSRMESAMMKLKNRKVKFRTEASGALRAAFSGEVVFKKGNELDYRAAGEFTGKEHKLFLACDGRKLRGGAEANPFEMDCPSGLRSALLIGLARMGLMHNISRLIGNKPPDHSDGTVFDWLVVQDAAFNKNHKDGTPLPTAELKQHDKKLIVVFYKLATGDNKNAGDVELWIDRKTNLPTFRTITVHFPNGDMFVTEKYEWSKI
jgi:hypothetical protein